jgi:hypothetical protein
VDEPILDIVPAGQTAHEAPGAKNIPAAQEYCVGLAVGAADTEGVAVGILVGSNVGAAVGDTEGVAVGILVGSNVGAVAAGRVLMAEQLEESREEYGVS